MLVSALAVSVPLAQAQARSDAQPLPGFHIVTNPQAEVPRPAPIKLHPRPAALSDVQVSAQLERLGIHQSHTIKLPGVPTLQYQLEIFSNSWGSEVNTTSLENSNFYGGDGYVQVDINNVIPGTQYLLDCSLGMDGTFKVATMFLWPNGNTSWAGGSLSSFSNHLLIPFTPAPAKTNDVRAVISFNQIEFDGCQVDTISH
jgi:hypothetical protein